MMWRVLTPCWGKRHLRALLGWWWILWMGPPQGEHELSKAEQCLWARLGLFIPTTRALLWETRGRENIGIQRALSKIIPRTYKKKLPCMKEKNSLESTRRVSESPKVQRIFLDRITGKSRSWSWNQFCLAFKGRGSRCLWCLVVFCGSWNQLSINKELHTFRFRAGEGTALPALLLPAACPVLKPGKGLLR